MALRITNRSCFSVASLARSTDLSYLAAAMPARIKMIVMTIIISMSENPAARHPRRLEEPSPGVRCRPKVGNWKEFMRALPVGIFRPVRRHRLGLRVNVKNVVPAPAGGIRVILHGAQAPIGFSGHRIDWNFSQVAHFAGRAGHSLERRASR